MLKAMVFYGLSALLLTSGAANAATTCDNYSVVPGDTLRLISEQYYGDRELSPVIYNANAGLIGANPNSIEIGMELAIPCRENIQIPQPTAFLALVRPSDQTTENMASRFLAKAGNTPFIKQDNTGIIPDVIAAALQAGGYQNSLDIARPENISDVLQASAEPTALLSFPWVLPDCGDPTSLSPQSAYVCDHYTFSDPLYELSLGVFTLSDSAVARAQNASSFAGTTICVPQFHTPDMLFQNGVTRASANIVLAPNFRSCLDGIVSGSYDAFVADYQSLDMLAPASSNLVDIPAFAKKTSLHAVALNQNPAAVEVLGMVNKGMKEILMSGEWFNIVNQHLAHLSY